MKGVYWRYGLADDFRSRRPARLPRPASKGDAPPIPAEYVQSLIRRDQERAEQERLGTLLVEGLDSGNPVSIENLDDHFAGKKRALMDRMSRADRP